jgi:hypothetical protein
MAEEQNLGNIKLEYNSASSGLNMDQTSSQIKPGTLTYALNANVENFDNTAINYQNEQGNELCLNFPRGYTLIGSHFIPEQNKHIFFLVNQSKDNYGCQIGYMENNDCIYHTLVSATCLNFNINFPIHKCVHKITNCTTEIYWTDGFNPRRYLDITPANIPWKLLSGSPLCNPVYDIGNLDCNQIKIQPNFNIPQLNVIDIISGGNVISGTYQFAAQYSDALGNGYTSYYSVTNPTPISDTRTITQEFNTPVGKSIVVNVSNLDLTGQWQYFNLAVIKTVNSVTSVELLGTYFIEGKSQQIIYTGQIQDNIRLTIADIFEKFPYYDVADDVTAVQDILLWRGLKSNQRVNYQQIANKIKLLWETYEIPATENYADELNATNLKGFLRDEVYPFEIVFLLKNGMQTDGFHIPGREPNSSDLKLVFNTSEDFIEETETAPYWKIYNTASVLGNSLQNDDYKIHNSSPYQYGEFSYWESSEKYPCEKELWGDLAGQYIRHHKFPDVLISPIHKSKTFTSVASLEKGNTSVYPIGVKVDTSQIQTLIQNSTLTQEQKEAIVGFKLVRGDRTVNKSIVAKGILRNVGKYSREGKDYFFPNYPYNDLKEDPFLNVSNNAWKDQCELFNVQILQLTSEDEIGRYCEVEYTSCETNKIITDKRRKLETYTQCSITKPIINSPGVYNQVDENGGPLPGQIAITGYAEYDMWKITVKISFCVNYILDSYCFHRAGFDYEWTDPIAGPQKNYLHDDLVRYPKTLKGTRPVNVWNNNEQLEFLGAVRVNEKCNVEYPLKSIEDSLTDRQIFNSPETSFYNPYLGNILKLESVMFGKGIAHFNQVKDNAKYKLLTAEAQKDALEASASLGRITNPFNVSAMFAAYQSYLTIYVNGINKKNYAYSFNSIADYNYFKDVPNNLGVKQRLLNDSRYLTPAVQSTGQQTVDLPINNYQRESSVFLKAKTKIPFPSKSPLMVSGGNSLIEDNSRFTIGDKTRKLCAIPTDQQDITVVSYYASLKNKFINQWGKIYSYKTIDTGFQCIFTEEKTPVRTAFGGDTFINRFAFKTKLPFFIDNRVNAPDDSDIFYDEIGNIAYPKYWHSARSVLQPFSFDSGGVLPSVMPNIISYKAHNFDCPNKQEPATNNPSRTFYDGYFYLFAYGMPNFYCETSVNTDLRQAYNNKEGDFWPHVNSDIPDDWLQESNVSINYDNTYYYNTTYSKQNKENNFSHLPPDFDPYDKCFTFYPFRAIYSDKQQTDADNKYNSWLVYRPISYYDFPQNYGKLISLDGIQNRAILARFENKSLLYNSLLTIDTSNPLSAYIGNPKMFEAPPVDFAETDLGYVGTENKFLLKIPEGQITIDCKRGQIFLLTGTTATDLTAFGSGMHSFFKNNLPFKILNYFPNVSVDNHFTSIGLHGVYDSKYNRVIITKLDYVPLSDNISYDNYKFYANVNNTLVEIDVTDSQYFCNKSFTVSFSMTTKSWISFHSYLPNFYIAENNFFYSGINGCCDEFDFIVNTLVPATTTTTTTKILNCILTGTASSISCTLVGTAYEILPTTTTTTTTTTQSPGTTTTTTTKAVPTSCTTLRFTVTNNEMQFVEYYDCQGNYVKTFLGQPIGILTKDICVSSALSSSTGLTVVAVGSCLPTTTTTNTSSSTTTTTTTLAPIVYCLEGFTIETIYLGSQADLLGLPVGYNHPCPSQIGSHSCSGALTEITGNNVFIGESNLNNIGGSITTGSQTAQGTYICGDYLNLPTPLNPSFNWNSTSRYNKMVITKQQAIAISQVTGNSLVTFSLTYAIPKYGATCDTAHSNVTWLRLTSPSGAVYFNGCPSGNFATIDVCLPPTTTTTTTSQITTTTTTTLAP